MTDIATRMIDRPPAPLPEKLPANCLDAHAHIELITESKVDDPSVAKVIHEAASVGIDRIVQVGYNAEQSKWGADLADLYPGKILAAVALHPNEAPIVPDLEKDLATIAQLAKLPRVRAIGETGLDFFRTAPELQERQIYSFKKHIEIAKENNKALVIHDRDAHAAVLDTLAEVGAPEITVFHCFSGDAAMAKECVAKGYYLSFSGTVTFKNAPHLRDAALITPLELILAETDSPFLCPAPNRGALNTPAQTANVISFLANLKDIPVVDLINQINQNALRIFGEF
jgi:TatD DNase family protein